MLKSSFCNYIDEYTIIKGRTTNTGAGADAAERQADEGDKGVTLKIALYFLIAGMKKIA